MAFGTITSTTANAIAASVDGTKPTGLAVNDLMLAFHTIDGSVSSTPPAGWTLVRRVVSQDSRIFNLNSYYKFADASDVAATIFTFQGGTGNAQTIDIFRIPSAKFEAVDISSGTSNSGSNVTSLAASTLTPEVANSLIFLYQGNQGDGDASTYVLATSSPTFTEAYDGYFYSSNLQKRSIAYGIRPQTTATGNGTVTINNGSRMAVQMIVISPNQDLTATATDTSTVTDGTVSTVKRLFATIVDTLTPSEALTVNSAKIWRTALKNAGNWINPDKS